MEEEKFNELMQAVKEGAEILKGTKPAARITLVTEGSHYTLSPEATLAYWFCKISPAIKVNHITAGVSIWLGNMKPGSKENWVLYPRMLCSRECFKEMCDAGLLIHVMERWETDRKSVV